MFADAQSDPKEPAQYTERFIQTGAPKTGSGVRVFLARRIADDLLRAEGLVVGRSGAGWFVRERPAVQRLARNRLSRDERVAGRGTFATNADDGGWEPSVHVTIRREPADGQPVQLATSRLPGTVTAGTAIEHETTGPGGLYAWVGRGRARRTPGEPVAAGWRDALAAVRAPLALEG